MVTRNAIYQRRRRARLLAAGLTSDGTVRTNYTHAELKGLKGRAYHRAYRSIYRAMRSKTLCDCGRPAVGLYSNDPVCEVCFRLPVSAGNLQEWRTPTDRPVRQEPKGCGSYAFFDPPRTEIGYGSLAQLEARLATIAA